MSANPLATYQRLSKARRRLLPRALITLAAASAAVALLPFRRAIRFGCAEGGRTEVSADDVVWAVETISRRMPWRTVCLQKGLAVQYMLRSAGIDARLHYGARHDPASRDLEAHVWVTVGGRAVIGGEGAGGFAAVATFP